MALKTYKPTTPSLRQLVLVDRAGLWKGKMRVFRGLRARQSDVKKAIVTLEEGHSIDVTTGL